MFIWIFVHLRNPINVRQIELLIVCLYSEGSEDRFVVVQHFWCRKIRQIVCRIPRKWMESKFLDQYVDVVFLAPKLFSNTIMQLFLARVKKEEIWLSRMTKAPTPTNKSKTKHDNTTTPPKTSITQPLRTDLGRSVGVAIATQLVWLNQFTGFQPSH